MASDTPQTDPIVPDDTLGDYHAFEDPVQDQLLGLILALGAEVWVLRDRLHLLEHALADLGVDPRARIEGLARDEERLDAMQQDRAAFMTRFMRAVRNDGAGEPLSRVEPFRGAAI